MRICDPESLPADAPAIDFARAWANIGNTSFANWWLDQTPGVTDEIVMELRRLADGIGRLREPWKFRDGHQMEMFQ